MDSLEEAEGEPAEEEADGGDEASDVGDEGEREEVFPRQLKVQYNTIGSFQLSYIIV